MQDNIVVLDVFYKDFLVEERWEVRKSSIWILVSEIGGVVGLFLGASIATCFEGFELGCLLCLACADRRRLRRSPEVTKDKGLYAKYALRKKNEGEGPGGQQEKHHSESGTV